jgi:hypothetical protein
MKKNKLMYDAMWIWQKWNDLDFLQGQMNMCACDIGFNASKTQKKQALHVLRFLKSKIESLLQQVDNLIKFWEKQ